jgi:o-succinylbenzoate synthase
VSINISSIEIREIALQRRSEFISSRARVKERRILLVTVKDRHGVEGWAECSAPEEPRYCEEWTKSAWEVLNSILAPVLLNTAAIEPSDVRHYFEPYRGNRMAKAAIEAACWDLQAQELETPLWQLLGGTPEPIPCGVAIGIVNSVEELLDRIREEVDSGYKRVKLKIGRDWDIEVIEAVRDQFPKLNLMVDANGAYRLEDIPKLRLLDQFDLMMLEQPFAPDDLSAYRCAQDTLRTPICMDETIVSILSTKAAVEFNLCHIINVKTGRIGGLSESREIIQFCREKNIPTWCGAQHEAGIGRAQNIALATLTTRQYPSEVSASKRYWDEDIILPEITIDTNGTVLPSMKPGFGFDVNRALIDSATQNYVIHRK